MKRRLAASCLSAKRQIPAPQKNMKLFRSKIFLSVILLVIAGALAFVALPNLYDSQSTTVNVIQLTGSITSGTEIKDYMLTTKQIGAFGIDGSVIKDKKEIVGKYAAYNLRGETILYADQFVDTFSDAAGAAETLLKDGDQLMTITVDAASSVGGLIKTGSIVDIYTKVLEKEEERDEYGYVIEDDLIDLELTPILTNVRVYKVQNSNLQDITELQREWRTLKAANDSASEDFGSSLIPTYATVIVNKEQALTLVQQEYNGQIMHMVLSPDGKAAAPASQPAQEAPAAQPAAEPAPVENSNPITDALSGLLGN